MILQKYHGNKNDCVFNIEMLCVFSWGLIGPAMIADEKAARQKNHEKQ